MKFQDVTDIVVKTHPHMGSRREFFAHCKEHGLTKHETKQEYNRIKDKRNRVWQNDKYIVHVTYPSKPNEEPSGKIHPRAWIHLSIRNLDGSAKHDWREFQDIKNTLLGTEYEGIELYPAESRLLDECNQFHIWCVPNEEQIPVGRQGRRVSMLPIMDRTFQRDARGKEFAMIDGQVIKNPRLIPLGKQAE